MIPDSLSQDGKTPINGRARICFRWISWSSGDIYAKGSDFRLLLWEDLGT